MGLLVGDQKVKLIEDFDKEIEKPFVSVNSSGTRTDQ